MQARSREIKPDFFFSTEKKTPSKQGGYYYPFGMTIKERTWQASEYRFSFNGKEKDDEVKGSGNSMAFEARIYDSRLGRFLSVDPLFANYAWQSTYAFAANNPIALVDVKGMGPGDGENKGDKVQKGEGPEEYAERNGSTLDELAESNPDVFKNYPSAGSAEEKCAYWKNTSGKNWVIHEGQQLNKGGSSQDQTNQMAGMVDINLGMTPPLLPNGANVGGDNEISMLGLWSRVVTLEGIGYSIVDNNYDHKTYPTTKGVKKNIYKANGKLRSQTAAQFARASKIVRGVSFGLGGISLGFDIVGSYNYLYNDDPNAFKVHPAKTGFNAFMTGVGLFGGPYGATAAGIYFGVDATVGWGNGAKSSFSITNQNRSLLHNSGWNSMRMEGGLK